jgi:hypothetical protein
MKEIIAFGSAVRAEAHEAYRSVRSAHSSPRPVRLLGAS